MRFAISRVEFYKFQNCGAVFAETERKLARYDNPDWQPDKTDSNVYFVKPSFSGSLEDHILQRKKEYKCRMCLNPDLPLERQTNVMGQAIFAISPDLCQSLMREEQIAFFRACYLWWKRQFPTAEILSAVIHFDETNAHMHLNFLPTVIRETDKGEKTVFSSSAMFDGKDAFTKYQDDFYDYVSSRFPSWKFERKREESRPHLTVQEFKQLKDENNPSLRMKLENAKLREENSYLRKALLYIREVVPFAEKFVDKVLTFKER